MTKNKIKIPVLRTKRNINQKKKTKPKNPIKLKERNLNQLRKKQLHHRHQKKNLQKKEKNLGQK